METAKFNRIFHRYSLGILLVSLIVIMSFASASGETSGQASGRWSFQFGIDKDFNLDNFAGMHLSIRKHCSAQRAWRLGTKLAVFTTNSDGNREYTISDTGNVVNFMENNSTNTQANVKISLLHEWHPVRDNSINMIVGIGPELGLALSNRTTSNRDGETSDLLRESRRNSKNYSAGLKGIMGVEWFFTSRMSLIAEYSLSFAYSHGSAEYNITDNNKSSESKNTLNQFILATNSVNFGVSVYF